MYKIFIWIVTSRLGGSSWRRQRVLINGVMNLNIVDFVAQIVSEIDLYPPSCELVIDWMATRTVRNKHIALQIVNNAAGKRNRSKKESSPCPMLTKILDTSSTSPTRETNHKTSQPQPLDLSELGCCCPLYAQTALTLYWEHNTWIENIYSTCSQHQFPHPYCLEISHVIFRVWSDPLATRKEQKKVDM